MADISNRKMVTVLLIIIALLLVIVSVTRLTRNTTSGGVTHYDIANASHLRIDGTVLDQPRVISQFHLMADNGKPFIKDNLQGHWTLVFFGFSNCGYVCPTTLSALNKMIRQLRAKLPQRLLPQVVMVSVDPDRDSVKRMHAYVRRFNAEFIGLRGSLQQTSILAQQMSVVFSKVAGHGDNYMVNHSAELMLLDPDGNLRAFFSYPHQAEKMTHDYLTVIRAARKTRA